MAVHVAAQPGFRDRAVMDLQQVCGGDATSSQLAVQLVRGRHQAVEDLHRHRHEPRMRDPGAVVAVTGLALLVGAHLRDARRRWRPGRP